MTKMCSFTLNQRYSFLEKVFIVQVSCQHSLQLLAGVDSHAMNAPLAFGVKHLITLVTLVFKTSWKVETLHMPKRSGPVSADLATQVALELPNVFPFSDLAGVSVQVLLNFSSVPLFQ